MNNASAWEQKMRMAVGLILWAISSVLTAELFLGFAGDDLIRKLVLFLLAIGLEGAKVMSWRMGNAWRALAVSLISLSAIASLGTALQTVEQLRSQQQTTAANAKTSTAAYQRKSVEIQGIDAQIVILIQRLAALPPDFSSATKQINDELERLRQRRDIAVQNQESAADSVECVPEAVSATMFDLIARVFGCPSETVMLIILLFLAINLEIAALMLAGRTVHTAPLAGEKDEPTAFSTTKAERISKEQTRSGNKASDAEFLSVAIDGADLPYIHGREATAKRLGIGSYEAKKHVRSLVAAGKIMVVGKRMMLNDPESPELG